MKLTVLLPWICVAGLGAGLAFVFVSSQGKDAELAKLRAESARVQQLQTDLDEAQAQSKRQADQIADFRKDNQELLRLRSEVGQLRNEKQQLSKQADAAQTQAQLAQMHADQAMKAGSARAVEIARLQAEMEARAKATAPNPQRDACVNNLRQIDAAKQQWALEYNRPANAAPTPQDIAPYLTGNVMPVCPNGGTYTLNVVSNVPSCSIPGHVLQ